MTLLLLLFLLVCIYNIKFSGNVFYENTYLSMKHTLYIRGILSISILMGHTLSFIQFSYGNSILDFILGCFIESGYLAVGIFFLFSGYGLMHSFIKKGELSRWIFK